MAYLLLSIGLKNNKGEIKMKRYFNLLSVFVLLLGLSGVANAYEINWDYIPSGPDGNELTSPYSGVTIETFDGAPLWTWSGNGAVVSGSTGINAAPFGVFAQDATNYVTVPKTDSSDSYSYTATLNANYNYFGIWWGSMDTYNTLSFDNGLFFTGSSIAAPGPANGDQTSFFTNFYVNFLDLPSFNSFTMTSTQYAFEADNIAVGQLPEPATMLLLGLGLIGLAGARRKFKK